MTPDQLVTELRGNACRCGTPKRPMMTLCGKCYRALPREMQLALYRRVGKGYEEAYAAAAGWLDAHVHAAGEFTRALGKAAR